MRRFDVKQADLTVQGVFSAPALTVLRGEPRYLEGMYSSLGKYGLGLNEINLSLAPVGPLGERHILFGLPRIAAGVKVTAAGQEVGFNDARRATFEDIKAIVISSFDALTTIHTDVKFAAFVITLNVHGIVEGSDALDFLKALLGKPPEGLGPPTGGAIGFYYGAEGPRQNLAIIMDGSAIVPRGVYMRITAGFDGGQLKHTELPDVGLDVYRRVSKALQLTTNF